jgi:hypothetical protein
VQLFATVSRLNQNGAFVEMVSAKQDCFLTFIKDIQASLPSDPQGIAIRSVMGKAMGCNHCENNRDNTEELSWHMDGSLNIYKEDLHRRTAKSMCRWGCSK